MKRLVITCSLIAGLSIAASAQTTTPNGSTAPAPNGAMTPGHPANGPMNPEQMQLRMAESQSKRMQNQLQLTDEQYKGVYAANLEFAKGMQEMRTPAPGKVMNPGDRQKLEAAKDAKFKQILTADQYTKYSATRRPNMPANMPPGAPGAPAAPAPAPVKN